MTGKKKNSLGSKTMLLMDEIYMGHAELVVDQLMIGKHRASLSGICKIWISVTDGPFSNRKRGIKRGL